MAIDPRGETPAGKNTIRDQIILAIQNHLGNVNGDVLFDEDDPSKGRLFDFCERGTLDDIPINKTPMATIEEGDQTPDGGPFMHEDSTVRIFVNFKVVNTRGVDVYSLLNYYIGRVVKELVRPEIDGLHIAEKSLSVRSAGNSMQYNGASDPEPGATVLFDVELRHVLGDPFKELLNG